MHSLSYKCVYISLYDSGCFEVRASGVCSNIQCDKNGMTVREQFVDSMNIGIDNCDLVAKGTLDATSVTMARSYCQLHQSLVSTLSVEHKE